jgi:hypothetical protein
MVSAGKHPKAGKKTTGKVPSGDVCLYHISMLTILYRDPTEDASELNISEFTSSRF